jgi:hypothetical protein
MKWAMVVKCGTVSQDRALKRMLVLQLHSISRLEVMPLD